MFWTFGEQKYSGMCRTLYIHSNFLHPTIRSIRDHGMFFFFCSNLERKPDNGFRWLDYILTTNDPLRSLFRIRPPLQRVRCFSLCSWVRSLCSNLCKWTTQTTHTEFLSVHSESVSCVLMSASFKTVWKSTTTELESTNVCLAVLRPVFIHPSWSAWRLSVNLIWTPPELFMVPHLLILLKILTHQIYRKLHATFLRWMLLRLWCCSGSSLRLLLSRSAD